MDFYRTKKFHFENFFKRCILFLQRRPLFFKSFYNSIMKRVDFIIQEYHNRLKRKNNNKNSTIIFMYYIAETLSKPISKNDRKRLFMIYKKLYGKIS